MIKDRDTAVIYPNATCNLKCRYCGIDKNPALGIIDKMLDESFKDPTYYFEQIKKNFPNRGQLRKIETWGGEPFLRMDRIYDLLDLIIDYFPYFDQMYSSTNFSFTTWTDQVFGLFDRFRKWPYRDFNYCLQLSCDGPEYINDAGRGKGTTKRCVENFNKFVGLLAEGRLPDNVKLTCTVKPTLDNETTAALCDKQKIIDYYQFFEDTYVRPIKRLKLSNVDICCPIPNTAVPSPVTVEEGKMFAEFVRLCREIEWENNNGARYLQYYDEITPFTSNITQDVLTYNYAHNHCGTGTSIVSFLPQGMYAACHEGFTQMAEEYGEYAVKSERINTSTINLDEFIGEQKVKMCVDEAGQAEHERKIAYLNDEHTTAKIATSTVMIVALAMAGQIESKYIHHENALKAAIFIQAHTSYCIKDNLNITGSYTLPPLGIYKLLLNGAMEYIQHEGELKTDDFRG